MKQTSPSFSMRTALAACAALLGATMALAQSSSPSTHPDTHSQSSPGTNPGPGTKPGAGTSSTDAGAMTGRDTTTTATTDKKLGFMDRRFVTKAADSGMAEVSLAELATQRATNPEVKSYAQKLIDDHRRVNSELMTLASEKNVKLDKDDGKDRHYRRLSNRSGSEFDQEFVEHMIDEHEKDVKLFEKAAQDAKDPEIKNFAAKHVDHLRMHLQQAQSLRSSTMATGRDSSMSGRADSTTGTSPSPTDSATGTKDSGSDRSGTYSTPSSTESSSSTDPTKKNNGK